MYTNTSESFNNLITKPGRTFHARILLGDNVLEGLSSVKTSSGSNNGEALTLGSTISKQVEITMDTPEVSLAGQEFELQIGLKLDEDSYEYIPVGLFTPEKITNKQKKTSFTGYDRMMKLSGSYISDLTDETDTISVLNEISNKTGAPISTIGLVAIPMEKPVGYTYRETVAVIAQLYGCFANVNRAGTIELHFWEDTGYSINADAGINGFTHGDSEFKVEKITCITSCDEVGNSNSIVSGTGEKGIIISNEFMTQEILDSIYEKIKGFSYTPVSCPVILGDPRLEPWDYITIIDAEGNSYKTPIMSLSFEYDGGLSGEIASTVAEESEEENDYKGPMQQLQEKVSGLKVKLAFFSREVEERFEDYVTHIQMDSAIEASASEINLNVAAVRNSVDALGGRVDSAQAALELKVDSETLISEINASADVIRLSGNRFVVDSTNLKITEDGTLIAVNGEFKGIIKGSSGEFTEGFSVILDVGDGYVFGIVINDQLCKLGYDADTEGTALIEIEPGCVGVSGLNLNMAAGRSMNVNAGMQITLDAPEIHIADSAYGNHDFELCSTISEIKSELSDHKHYRLYNGTLDDYVSYVSDSGIGYLRCNTADACCCGSASRPWYKTYTNRLEVLTSRPVFQPTYDNTVSYATNCFIGTGGVLSRTTNTSSKTIKHDIKLLDSDGELSADKLYDIKVYQFKYNDDIITDKEDARYGKDLVGFIIEDLNDKYPIAVDKPSDNVKEWSWNAQYLIPPILKLIQEQNNRLIRVEAMIESIYETNAEQMAQ